MKVSSLLKAILYVAACHVAATDAAEPQTAPASAATQQVMHAGSQPSIAGPAAYFTGKVRIDPVWAASGDINASGGLVTFEPGARSAWHTHPKGQYFVVVSGVGYTQEWGKPIRELHPGDVVWCPPGVKHWHGAAPANAMTHLAVTGTVDGKNVEWMEKVTDEQYNAR
ncbi:cupin domain-containing protein [Burkholderia ambifaria]|jgi:quercetin dioxygenase-like cupin family protein|uniref:(R)-mandelonitrile lyase n=1 Tax=Burkholderia TaxID=32008 RepID=UPI00158DBE3A|nr:cupin domain-containing protein [Burkholderia ambifaria]